MRTASFLLFVLLADCVSLNGAADWSDKSDWSDYDDAASDTSDGDAAENSYFQWCDELATAVRRIVATHWLQRRAAILCPCRHGCPT